MEIVAPFSGTVVAITRAPADPVTAGAALVVLEAMKMEHEVVADADGVLQRVEVAVGETVQEGQVLAVVSEAGGAEARAPAQRPVTGDSDERRDLEEVRRRHAL